MWELKKLRLQNPKNVILGNLNINSLSGKFDQLSALYKTHVDIMVLTETKLDEMFATSSFLIDDAFLHLFS